MTQDVADIRANKNENIVHAFETIGRSSVRRKVFEAIYTGKRPIKTVSEIMKMTTLSRVQVLQEGGKLSDNQIVNKIKINGETAYKKLPFFSAHKRKILGLVSKPKSVTKIPTKQRPKVGNSAIRINTSTVKPKLQQITIDDIGSFILVKSISHVDKSIKLNKVREEVIKNGLCSVIGEHKKHKDWGGEKSDFYTTNLMLKGRRIGAAFALKGRATQGKLTPKKMGKNGDQIARLFTTSAIAHFIVYHGDIDESIVAQMQAFALGKAMAGAKIYYSIINGDDLNRLVQAYREHFKF